MSKDKNDEQTTSTVSLDELKAMATEFAGEDQTTEAFQAAMVVLASFEVGPSVARVTQLTGLPRDIVKIFGQRLRASGIWRKKFINLDYEEGDGSSLSASICLAVLVAKGLVEITQEAA